MRPFELLDTDDLTSRRSREKRESQVLLIRLTQISQISRRALTIARAFLRDVYTRQSRQARAKRRAICEIREICVRKRISVREKLREICEIRVRKISVVIRAHQWEDYHLYERMKCIY